MMGWRSDLVDVPWPKDGILLRVGVYRDKGRARREAEDAIAHFKAAGINVRNVQIRIGRGCLPSACTVKRRRRAYEAKCAAHWESVARDRGLR